MKEIVNIYRKHKKAVDDYIILTIKSAGTVTIDMAATLLKQHRFFQLAYEVDPSYRQKSPVLFNRHALEENIGVDKSHYFTKLLLDENGFYVSNPFIHYRTGKVSVTAVRKLEDGYLVFDCDLVYLLEELHLIEYNTLYDRFKRCVYILGTVLLTLIALALIVYGGFSLSLLLTGDYFKNFFHDIFKAIIAVTLGIAIFDLARQIIEHEVLFHTFNHEEALQYKVLGRFLISIVIALSIETMMVVFKITLADFTKMLSAFYLLIGTTVMLVGLAYFYKTISNVEKNDS